MSGLRILGWAILWFCRMGIGVWSFLHYFFLLFCDQKGYIVMYKGGFVLPNRMIPWWFACLYVSGIVVYVLYKRLTVSFSSGL